MTTTTKNLDIICGAITACDPVNYANSNYTVTFKAKNGRWLATTEEISENTKTRVTSITRCRVSRGRTLH